MRATKYVQLGRGSHKTLMFKIGKMKRFLLLFGINLSPIAVMTRKSGKAFSLFNKTLKRLDKLNDSLSKHKADHIAAITALQADHDTLHAQQEKNERLRVKLSDFVA